ncbi:beta-L-arabinofuranosidase domain-containing protein [Saccharibacillus sp. JS10]|uniref:beta-L-arabinofuranosidase domain-containing protein n=1 Tax=Saccharibacillus sp. JS10 TaxID=2950552 RepID=UPI002108D1F1|nr:beta-L-arabinofuranosidase domain-containing protein [Saccharibacillus sp. JS10]MCQ4086206.1 glycoside hydrolase family 127 protein [Saccharibacillus sp. JS10]
MPIQSRFNDYPLDHVRIDDAYLQQAFDQEVRYLKRYQNDRLLAEFRNTKGLIPLAESYPGWENTEIRGHTLGHYLKAAAQAYHVSHDAELLERLNDLIDELALCQLESGYLSAFPQELFDRIEQRQPAWVPWYTMHKIVAGLVAVFEHTGNLKALHICEKLGDWIADRTASWTPEVRQIVLSVEYGGMNDCLYDLYRHTGKPSHLDAAHAFDELSLFEPVAAGQDVLKGKHANTTIPKFIGALNRYRILGENESFYLKAAEQFWTMVVEHHSYITGGNSEWEHFGEPDELDCERSNFTAETCNTYNMLKLSRELFKLSGDMKYAHFYENTFLNAIVSSQHPDTGMTMYFQPMATGYFKVYSSPFEHFWCCTGTGMESFSKLNDSLYFQSEDGIAVLQYFSSELDAPSFGLKLKQRAALPESDTVSFTVSTTAKQQNQVTLRLRLPDWLHGEASLTLGGESVPIEAIDGFAVIRRLWADGDRIQLRLPMTLRAIGLPDAPHTVAFRYGPAVLSAGLGTADMTESATGVAVSVPTRSMLVKDFITVEGSPEDWLASLPSRWIKREDALEFVLQGTDEDHRLVFTPHYKRHDERYGIYWRIVKADSRELQAHICESKRKGRVEDATIDSLPVGNDQYELEHRIQGDQTFVDVWDGSTTRRAENGGYFGYTLSTRAGEDHVLEVTYFSGHRGDRPITVKVNDVIIADGIPSSTVEGERGFHHHHYLLPADLIGNQETLDVRFEVNGEETGIFDILRIMRPFGTDASLNLLEFDTGILEPSFDPAITDYTLTVPAHTNTVFLQASLRSKNGLLVVNDILVEESIRRPVFVEDNMTSLTLTTFAEDHQTSKTYTVQIIKN